MLTEKAFQGQNVCFLFPIPENNLFFFVLFVQNIPLDSNNLSFITRLTHIRYAELTEHSPRSPVFLFREVQERFFLCDLMTDICGCVFPGRWQIVGV